MKLDNIQSEFEVAGMDCNDEVKAVKAALFSLPGVSEVEPNLVTSKVRVTHKSNISSRNLIQKIESAGLKVQIEDSNNHTKSKYAVSKQVVLVSIAGLLLCVGLLLEWSSQSNSLLTSGMYLLSALSGGILILPKALRSIKTFTLDINLLMLVAVIGAIVIGEYSEGSAVVFLFALAELLESFSLERARRSVRSLLTLVPELALVRNVEGTFVETPISNVQVNAIVRVRSGARIPVDGIVVSGSSAVNQAPITGESLPVDKNEGDKVMAGTINGEGSLEIRVTQSHKDTKISQIIRQIEDAQKSKAPVQRFVDTFSRYYTPTVFIGAIGVMLIPTFVFGGDWNIWFYRSLVLLVVACPCALVIATPVSVVSGLTAMAKRGILIKGGAGLETIGKLKALAVDKTGTITEGAPKVLQVYSFNSKSEEEILSVAASIDVHSTHPLAKAVVAEATKRKIKFGESVDYRAINGRGAEAVLDGHVYFVGNHRYAHEYSICSDELERKLKSIEEQAQSVVVVGHRPHPGCLGEVFGVLGLGDTVRSDAKEAVESLHAVGIQSVIMLSGDNQLTVDAISKKVGIDEAYGDLLPADKVLKIKSLKERYGSVAMIGDGVNDAPAMATATLGIAMGASGTDTAIETSDITLMQDKLSGIAEAIGMGKRTLNTIWFNTGFALATKILFLGLSIAGFSSLWLAVAADAGATLLVIANALRLLNVSSNDVT